MNEINIGSVNKRQLTLRWYLPREFERWDFDRGFFFAPLRMLSPVRWWKAATSRHNWAFECKRHVGVNHRCYCATGSLIDGRIKICGFALCWWFSDYRGPVPCWCDKAIVELAEEMECEQ